MIEGEGQCETPKDDLIRGYRDEIARLNRCIAMAMGCLDAESKNTDERLAWYRLWDACIGNGKEPRAISDLPPLQNESPFV